MGVFMRMRMHMQQKRLVLSTSTSFYCVCDGGEDSFEFKKKKVTVFPSSFSYLHVSLSLSLSRLLNARHMLLHLRDEQLESRAQTEIKPLLLLPSNSETCSLLSRQREGGGSATILAQETLQKMLCQAAILHVIFGHFLGT